MSANKCLIIGLSEWSRLLSTRMRMINLGDVTYCTSELPFRPQSLYGFAKKVAQTRELRLRRDNCPHIRWMRPGTAVCWARLAFAELRQWMDCFALRSECPILGEKRLQRESGKRGRRGKVALELLPMTGSHTKWTLNRADLPPSGGLLLAHHPNHDVALQPNN